MRLNVGFLSIEDAPSDLEEIGKREELSASARLALTPYWSFTAVNRRNLQTDDAINIGFGLTYQDECILFSAQVDRRFTEDRDVEPDTSLRFVIKLKHLG